MLNSKNLMNLIEEFEKLKNLFGIEDPDTIVDNLIMEMNRILNELAPSTTRPLRIRKEEMQFIDQNIIDMKKEADLRLTMVINTHDVEDWRIAKFLKQILKSFR